MKILIHSNAPWAPTGYGRQCAHLARQLKFLGHDVAISAFYGLSGAPITWEGMPVFPNGNANYGVDVLPYHAANFGADVIITLMDFWQLRPVADTLRNFRVLAWLPVDCTPLGRPDADVLRVSGATPVAMSRFGHTQLEEAGFAAEYVPHGVDLQTFHPPADRRALRAELGLDEFFLVGICAANTDAFRKAWPEQFEAFRLFAASRDDARLMVHSQAHSRNGFPLDQLAVDIGIGNKVIFSDQYPQVAGLMGDDMMVDWFGMLDVLSACSYAEGFGLPIAEALACGTPVVTAQSSAMHEVGGAYARVPGDRWWNPVHRAWWRRPDVERIRVELERVYVSGRSKASVERRVADAGRFDIRPNTVRWREILDTIMEEDAAERQAVEFEEREDLRMMAIDDARGGS